MENLSPFGLLAVGMITVFSILLIVIYLGKALIAIVNKVAPAEEPKKAARVAAAPSAVSQKTQNIIQAAVSQLTGGKGKVAKITKL